MVMVLETVGLPPEDVTIILAVDWLLDRLPMMRMEAACDWCSTFLHFCFTEPFFHALPLLCGEGELKIRKRLNLFTGSEQQSMCLATPLGLESSTTSARTNLTISENRPPSQSCPIWHYICQMTRLAWRKYMINSHQARWWRLWVGANDRCWGERTPGKMRQRSENFGEAFYTKWNFETLITKTLREGVKRNCFFKDSVLNRWPPPLPRYI